MTNQDFDAKLSRENDRQEKYTRAIEKHLCPICKKDTLLVDWSMALIQCDGCGISFEYRYNRGVIPYKTMLDNTTYLTSLALKELKDVNN